MRKNSNNSIERNSVPISSGKLSLRRLVLAIALAGFSLTAQAGKITSIPSATVPGVQDGFGGLNFGNVEVILNGAVSTFDEATGAYSFDIAGSNFSYESRVFDDDVSTTLMGKALAKDWPVGEPAGIKIVNDDFDVKNDKPSNCIMSTSYLDGHFLDEADPLPVLCSGPFQSHKRYKVAMLPSTVDGGIESIDLVFNVEAEIGSRDYQVFQKINNWTDGRLKGFTIQVGSGTGGSFIPASDGTAGVGVANLSLSVPSLIWSPSQLANFSTGLFGPIDTKHDRPAGFFDPNTRAGYTIVEYPNVSGVTDTLTSGATLGSAYADVPAGAGAAPNNQFGNWLSNNWLPYGIFFDEDGNPDTDNELVAWYAYNPALSEFGWMRGVADGFAAYPDPDIIAFGANPLYSMGVIDDLVNVGLNYVVTVGDVTAFPGSAFTIRITPVKDDSGMSPPSYVAQGVPVIAPVYDSTDAIITLTPGPFFVPGNLLTARVGDADLNSDPLVVETTTVDVTTSDNSVLLATITLDELGPNRGVFVANLPDAFSNVAAGTVVTVTYNDAVATAPGDITASSTAATTLPAGVLQFSPVSYTAAENDGSVEVTVERTGGTAGEVSVEYGTLSGTAIGNEDYVPDTASLIFADGDTSKTITVALVNDTVAEAEESFSLVLSNAQGGASLGAPATTVATVTITDTDTDTVTDTSVSSDGGSSNGLFSLGWITCGLVVIGLLGRVRRTTS